MPIAHVQPSGGLSSVDAVKPADGNALAPLTNNGLLPDYSTRQVVGYGGDYAHYGEGPEHPFFQYPQNPVDPTAGKPDTPAMEQQAQTGWRQGMDYDLPWLKQTFNSELGRDPGDWQMKQYAKGLGPGTKQEVLGVIQGSPEWQQRQKGLASVPPPANTQPPPIVPPPSQPPPGMGGGLDVLNGSSAPPDPQTLAQYYPQWFGGRGDMNAMANSYAGGGAVRVTQGMREHHAAPQGLAGAVHSATPGRADLVQTHVKEGSYVWPADVVSILGQGNSDAGAQALDQLSGKAPRTVAGYKRGGVVPVHLSGKEYVMEPHVVSAMGGGDHEHGGKAIDAMVKHLREHESKRLKSAPPPR